MVCICTTWAKLSSDFLFLNFPALVSRVKHLKITPSRKARCCPCRELPRLFLYSLVNAAGGNRSARGLFLFGRVSRNGWDCCSHIHRDRDDAFLCLTQHSP